MPWVSQKPSATWARLQRRRAAIGRHKNPATQVRLVFLNQPWFLREPSNEDSPDRLFDRHWALALLERAMERLQHEWTSGGKAELFAQLKGFVSGEKGLASYAEAAAQANLSTSALKSAIFRLRRRYHDLVREEVGHTLADPNELKEELRHLVGLFGSG